MCSLYCVTKGVVLQSLVLHGLGFKLINLYSHALSRWKILPPYINMLLHFSMNFLKLHLRVRTISIFVSTFLGLVPLINYIFWQKSIRYLLVHVLSMPLLISFLRGLINM